MRSPASESVISSSCNPEKPSSSRYSSRCRSNGGNSTKRAFTVELYATCVGTQVAYVYGLVGRTLYELSERLFERREQPTASNGPNREADVPSLFQDAREWHRN